MLNDKPFRKVCQIFFAGNFGTVELAENRLRKSSAIRASVAHLFGQNHKTVVDNESPFRKSEE